MPNNPFPLGRIHAPDERDGLFRLSAIVTEEPKITYRYWYANGWWGNQGNSPKCVAYSWTHWVEDGPVTHKGVAPIVNPDELYNEAQLVDEWQGEDYDGTSVRAGAKALQQRGLISEYRWAWDADTVANTILTLAPVVVGTNWYENMFYPDASGLIKVGGSIAGGHAYVLDGVNTKTKLFRIKNSWGRDWGKEGFAYISFDDMNSLIKDAGEACLASESPM